MSNGEQTGPVARLAATDRWEKDSPLGQWEQSVAKGLLEYLNVLEPPASLGVFGEWGCGKSGILKALKESASSDKYWRDSKILLLEPDKDGVFGDLSTTIESWHSSSTLLLVDELDKVEPGHAMAMLRRFGHLLRDVPADEKLGGKGRALVVACNLRRIKDNLSHVAGGGDEDDVDELISTVLGQRFYPTRAPADVALATFWKAKGKPAKHFWYGEPLNGSVNEEPGSKPASSRPPEMGAVFLWRVARSLDSANLRRLRQTLAVLEYFRRSYAAGARTQVLSTTLQRAPSSQERGGEAPATLADANTAINRIDLQCQLALAILILVRTDAPEMYSEWAERWHDTEVVLDALAAYESEFAKARAGTVPETKGSRELDSALSQLMGAGFMRTVNAATEGRLLLLWREVRSALLQACLPLPPVNKLKQEQPTLSEYLGDELNTYWQRIRPDASDGDPVNELLESPPSLLPFLGKGTRGREVVGMFFKEFLSQ